VRLKALLLWREEALTRVVSVLAAAHECAFARTVPPGAEQLASGGDEGEAGTPEGGVDANRSEGFTLNSTAAHSPPPEAPTSAAGTPTVEAREGGGSAVAAATQPPALLPPPPPPPLLAPSQAVRRHGLPAGSSRSVEVARLEAVHGSLAVTRRARLACALLLAALHATPQRRSLATTTSPPALLAFLACEVALLAGGAALPAPASPASLPRVGSAGDTGWLSLLSVAAVLVPAAKVPLTYARAALAVSVALFDDAALFLLALLFGRAALAERGA